MADRNEFKFDGKLYDKKGQNSRPVLNQDNVLGADNISVDKVANSDDIQVSFDIPISVVDGALCVTFEKDVEEV